VDSGKRTVDGGRGVVIRTYEARDAEAVWEMHWEGLRDTRSLVVPRQSAWDDDVRNVEDHYLGEGSHFWVVEDAGRIIGMAAVHRLGPGAAELKRMRVTGDRRGRGLGQRLLELAEEFCRAQGYSRIVLDTTDRMEAARRLYEKNGYVLSHEMPLGGRRIYYYAKELV
jgi:putative acetyltransferase